MPGQDKPFGIAIVGCGTVGGSAATLLVRDSRLLMERTGLKLELRHIVDVDFANARRLGLPENIFRRKLDEALRDEQTGVVVELIGGLGAAMETIERAIQAGKCVVTANKALLAQHGAELFAQARKREVSVGFEASCAGGIPIIRALTDGLIANRIDAIYGIVNGTCNFILTEMTQHGKTYADALAEAQKAGFAEADPTLDVSGGDSAHKLAILAGLAFAGRIDLDSIHVEGIDRLQSCDITFGQELGYIIKLLAIAQRQSDGLSLRVRPAFISKEHPLAWVSGPFNAVSVYGHATGHTMYYGRGAGGMPTASAVVADLVSVALGSQQSAFRHLRLWPDVAPPATQLPIGMVRSRYYIRTICQDKPGTFAQLATILAKHQISISSLLQHEPREDIQNSQQCGFKGVPVVITTYRSVESSVRQALAEIDKLDSISGPSVCIGIVDEHEENF
ncbi:MAG: homoserine dehydrogenase [Planctomycetes bacterium]|nr:homoserine dehydrogenase [Planctomycetota bacterium]